ncbi:MAG TPA: two-component regulator propeller domain-containing protein, partial [Bryobacteraceae bacterium]|nr:two-component regulator propeller domain-containing protein [Bryobacteraceae bacterium]
MAGLSSFLPLAGRVAAATPEFADPEYVIRLWEVDQGLPENSATAMVQTPDGYLWFGTFNGLVRFDGISFTVFDRSNTPQLPSSGIVNLHLDDNGQMWVSTMLGLVSVKDGKWQSYDAQSGWTGNYVRSFAETSSGDLYLMSFDSKLFRVRGNRLEALPTPPGVPLNQRSYIYVDDSDSLWLIDQRFVGKLVNGAWQPVVSPAALAQRDRVVGETDIVGAGRGGDLWIATNQGLHLYRGGTMAFETRSPWPMPVIWSMYVDSTGMVWICTSGAGLFRYSRNGGWRRFTSQSGLSYDILRFAFEDREGNLWVGSSGGGLLRFAQRHFLNIGAAEGLPERVVKSVAVDPKGGILAATRRGVMRFDGQLFHPVLWPGKTDALARGECSAFRGFALSTLVDQQGSTWVGSYDNGLFRIDRSGCHAFFNSADERPGPIYTLFEDSRGTIWIGSDGVAISFRNGSFHSHRLQNAPPLSSVGTFAEDPHSGTLWAGNLAGGL